MSDFQIVLEWLSWFVLSILQLSVLGKLMLILIVIAAIDFIFITIRRI